MRRDKVTQGNGAYEYRGRGEKGERVKREGQYALNILCGKYVNSTLNNISHVSELLSSNTLQGNFIDYLTITTKS